MSSKRTCFVFLPFEFTYPEWWCRGPLTGVGRRKDERRVRMRRTMRRSRWGGTEGRSRARRSPTLGQNTRPSSAKGGKIHHLASWKKMFPGNNLPARSFQVLPWGTSLFGLRPFYKNGEPLSRKSATEAFAAAAAVTWTETIEAHQRKKEQELEMFLKRFSFPRPRLKLILRFQVVLMLARVEISIFLQENPLKS